MGRARSRDAVCAALVGILFLLSGFQRLPAQGTDPIEDAINKIVQGSTSKEEDPKTPPKPPAVDVIRDKNDQKIKHETRPDGVEVFTRPDGTKQYVTPDGKTVTVRGDTGERILQAPGQEIQRRPPQTDDPADFRPHYQPPAPPPPNPDIPAPKEPLPDLRIPDPPNPGGHATGPELTLDPRLPPSLIKPSLEDRPRYTPLPPGTEDKLVSSTLTPGKTGVYVYGSGAVRTILPDGREVTTYPGLPQVNVRDVNGKVTTVTPDPDGIVRLKGGDTAQIDPGSGKTIIDYGNGTREGIQPNGASGYSNGQGGREYRGPNGELIQSTVKDATSGYTVRADGSGVLTVFDKNNRFVGVGTREGLGGIKFRDANGQEMVVSELFDPRKLPADTAVAKASKNAAYGQPPATGNYTPPTGPTIFSAISAKIGALKKQGDLKPADQETLQRLQTLEKAAREAGPGAKDLKRVLETVDATLKKGELERELKRTQERQAAQKASLDQEKKRVDADKAQLLLRETRAANEQKKARDDELSIQVERNGLTQLKIVLNSQDDVLKRREKAVQEDIAAALKRIDYSKYNLCPMGQPWDKCGGVDEKGVDHNALKKKWLNQQLAALLGPGRVAQIKKIAQERADLNKQLQALKDKDKAIKEKQDIVSADLKTAKEQAVAAKKERDRLMAGENQIQKQIDQTQTQADRLTKQIADLADALKKSANPPP